MGLTKRPLGGGTNPKSKKKIDPANLRQGIVSVKFGNEHDAAKYLSEMNGRVFYQNPVEASYHDGTDLTLYVGGPSATSDRGQKRGREEDDDLTGQTGTTEAEKLIPPTAEELQAFATEKAELEGKIRNLGIAEGGDDIEKFRLQVRLKALLKKDPNKILLKIKKAEQEVQERAAAAKRRRLLEAEEQQRIQAL